MNCPACNATFSMITLTEPGDTVKRRRRCPECGHIWQTVEISVEEHNSAQVASISNEFMKRLLHTLGENGDES